MDLISRTAAGVQGHLWQVTRELYSDVKSRVAHPEIPPDDFFDILQGLREGSKLSPLLFNLAVNDMEAELLGQTPEHPQQVGIFVKQASQGNASTAHLCASVWQYADDVALVASSVQELQVL
jgi:hypothetical protein